MRRESQRNVHKAREQNCATIIDPKDTNENTTNMSLFLYNWATKLGKNHIMLCSTQKGLQAIFIKLQLAHGFCIQSLFSKQSKYAYKKQIQKIKNQPQSRIRPLTSTISRANTVKLWLKAFEANSPLGRLWHCLLISSSIALRSTPSPAITRTTWLSGPCSAWK